MTASNATTLYYVHDPMCSWCWGFRPVWQQVKQNLPPSIKLISWVGGLAPDSDEPMADSMQHNLQATWKRIQQVIPGTQFNFEFWSRNTPRRSTYPACRAAIAARKLADREDEMTHGIQQAYYLQAKNPSDLDTLVEVAQSIGLDPDQFKQLMQSEQIYQLLEQELAQVRAIGVNSFPSIVLQKDDSRQDIKINYRSADQILEHIRQALAQ